MLCMVAMATIVLNTLRQQVHLSHTFNQNMEICAVTFFMIENFNNPFTFGKQFL